MGGEKVASIGGSGGGGSSNPNKSFSALKSSAHLDTMGVDSLIATIRENLSLPLRNSDGPFYYAIDHCFPIKGHGTVLTGTILSGSIAVNGIIELPELQITKKVKSMQMFRKAVKAARQGDRVGICVTGLESHLVERGIAITPGSVPLLSNVICLVKKVRFYRQACRSNSKFHITIGHNTVVATVTFFGHAELMHLNSREAGAAAAMDLKGEEGSSSSISGSGGGSPTFPAGIGFNFDSDFVFQEQLVGSPPGNLVHGSEPLQYMLLHFSHPIYCPLGSLVIGSRLETDANETYDSASSCRLAFYG